MNKDELKKRTKQFTVNIIKLTSKLPDSYLAQHIKKQIIRSATSVAANYRAACLAQSRASYIAKLSIVIEEADETEFWLELIEENNLLSNISSLKQEAHELASIFIVTRKSLMLNK
ncbi:four helix bundle protein [Carboxylicivirga caseinilyticus]|uniref:four helix bundle protein n=1 Tax=Carboxylicivirga caseinilyticus TaxID=3417572 RepID=UPI003D340678|nr:four helix bundle protein [Marinilabiliaceae bacterium A049]